MSALSAIVTLTFLMVAATITVYAVHVMTAVTAAIGG